MGSQDRFLSRGRELFSDWVEESGYTMREIGKHIGLTTGSVYALRTGKQRPGLDVAGKLEDLSEGKVRMRHWAMRPRRRFRDEGRGERRWLYFAQRKDGIVKIGWTVDVERRLKSLKSRCRQPVTLLLAIPGVTRKTERGLHKKLKGFRVHAQEWYTPSPQVFEELRRWQKKELEVPPRRK